MRDVLRAVVFLGALSACGTLVVSAAAQQPLPPVQPPPVDQPPVVEPPDHPAVDEPPAEDGSDEGAGGEDPGEQPPTGQPPTGQPPTGQPPAPPLPPPGQPPVQPAAPQPASPPQPGQPPYGGYPPQPGYGPPPGPGYAYGPPPPPPRPIEPPPKACCAWSLRYDPFDLIFRRVTLEGEIAWGDLPLSLELAPSYIFDHMSGSLDARGVEVAARIAWYVQGQALKGFWLKAHFSVEHTKTTLFNIVREGPEPKEERVAGVPNADLCDADSEPGTCKGSINSVVLGFMLGNSMVIPNSGGFALTGGIGLGASVTNKRQLQVDGDESYPVGTFYTANEGFVGRLRLLGSLSLGITF